MNFGFQGNQVLVSRKINLYNVIPGYSGASIFLNQLPVRERSRSTEALGRAKCPLTLEATENGLQLPRGHHRKRLRPYDFSELPTLGLSAPWPRKEARPAAQASPLVRSWDL